MHDIPIYTVDAFSKTHFRGNTCAVCIFSEWPEDQLLQDIATQNLYAETAFIVPRTGSHPELRWFTTAQEVNFCGYGTLSAGYVYLTHLAHNLSETIFATRHYGLLPVRKIDELFQIEVPVKQPLAHIFDEAVCAALGGKRPETMVTSERGDLLIVYAQESDMLAITPNFISLMGMDYYGYVLTSPTNSADYAYRYFSPRMPNVWEDPVNGASQSVLAPFWFSILNKVKLHGQAASRRGGDVYCEFSGGQTVKIGGHVTPYLNGNISLG